MNGGLWVVPYEFRPEVSGDRMNVYKLSLDDGSILASFVSPDDHVIGISSDGNGKLWLVSYDRDKMFRVSTGGTLVGDRTRALTPK
jgi:hypothetical protein